jgi:hypothetical protein
MKYLIILEPTYLRSGGRRSRRLTLTPMDDPIIFPADSRCQ